ncbi:MAG: glycosyltransferase, partial [Nanopusillaceae archaeon]
TKDWPKNYVINFGFVKREEVPEIMAAADILVLPGGNNPFDNERFPSKLPEYFAMGRPVILSKNFLGSKLENCLFSFILDEFSFTELFKKISKIKKNKMFSEMHNTLVIDQSTMIYNYRLLLSAILTNKEG